MKKFDKNQKNVQFIKGDCFDILKSFEPNSVDCVITSPPYFQEREKNKHFNLNQSIESYIDSIIMVSTLIQHVLKDEGSFWLNLGDSYSKGSLRLIPERIAIELTNRGWLLNNDIIWKKTSSTPTSFKKRLTNSYEHLYHFVKSKSFYYNLTTLDAKKNNKYTKSGLIKSDSNLTGVNYRKTIENSKNLTDVEKQSALLALDRCLSELESGDIKDFRFIIRGHNKVVSYQRQKEVEKNGYAIIKSRYNKPSDVWEILPEKDNPHYAPFPEELVEFPVKVSCPPNGIVLDPFSGSGTTCFVALKNKRNAIGIELREEFIKYAKERCSKIN